MGSSSIVSKRQAFRCDPGRIVQVKLQDSVQLQTVLALYDLVTVRNSGQTSYLRLKTSVKLHIDQMMRTRNFRVRNEVVESGSVTKSQKGKKAKFERKVGECFSGRHMHNVQKETHVFSVMTDLYKETCTVVKDEEDDRLLPHQIRRPRLTKGEKILKHSRQQRGKLFRRRSEIPCRYRTFSKIRHVVSGIFPCVKTTSLRLDAHLPTNAIFDMYEAEEEPSQKSNKGGAKGSVATLKGSIQLGCVSQDCYPRKSFST